MYGALADEGVPGYARPFLTLLGTRTPLIAPLPSTVSLAFGRKFRAAYAINLVFLTATFAALFRLGRRYASPRAGLLAVWIAGTMPILYGLARSFLVECGLIALVSVAIYLTADWNESSGA